MTSMTDQSHLEQQELRDVVRARTKHFHPLEIIPLFRTNGEPSLVRDFAYTFIWNCLLGLIFAFIAAMFTGRITERIVVQNMVIANVIGYSIHVLFMIGGRTIEAWVLRQSKGVITLYYTVVSTTGVVGGLLLTGWLLNWNIWGWLNKPGWYLGVAVNSFLISAILGVIFFWRERTLVAEMGLERERARMAEVERNATLANLRMLQAQIEPHFLFNTLANVTSLIHAQPDRAKLMLESFIHYLRSTLKSSREERTTLVAEFELMKQFLSILQIRMGDRLTVAFDLPDELGATQIPPMLVQPLVENAIKHGLEPKVEGGTLSFSAERKGDAVRLIVADTGLGFSGATSSGVGLKNVRERLQALYGDAGKLIIEDNAPAGTKVIIEIPA
jgi:signal transduction histidine kinase